MGMQPTSGKTSSRPCSLISCLTRPEEPSNFVTDAMEEFSKQRFIVTLAEHLSPDEERDLFHLGGIGDHAPIQIEQALIQQHIPRREPAEVYHDRLFGQGQFWKSVRRNIFQVPPKSLQRGQA